MSLEIRKKVDQNLMVIELIGSLDAITTKEFDAEFEAAAAEQKDFVLDFSGVEYLSSAGLRSILAAKKLTMKTGGSLKVLDPRPVVMEVFEVTKFAKLIEIVQTNGKDDNFPCFYPLRPIQRWMVDTNFQKAQSSMMNIGALFKLEEDIDMERMAAALNGILEAHDVFRCRLVFHPETGEICQRFDGEIEKIRVEICSEEAFEERRKELQKPYQLIDQPLYRIYLMIAPSGKYIYADFYHAIVDGISMGMLFMRELEMRYIGKEIKRQAPSYAQYVLEEADSRKETVTENVDYWHRVMAGFDVKKHLPPMDLQGREDWELATQIFSLSNVRNAFFRESSVNEQTFLMAASMLAIAKSTGAKEAIMSWVHNGRFDSSERRIMGLMFVQFPIRWDFSEDEKVSDYLNGLEKKIEEGIEHRQSIGVVYEERLEDECASFILQKSGSLVETGTFPFAGGNMTYVEVPANKASAAENVLDINIQAASDGTYSLVLKYDASRYSEEAMARYAAFVDEMTLALQDGERKLSEILR